MSDGGEIVGRIIPAKGDEDATFTVIDKRSRELDREACQHRRFILDERWNTVECGVCGAVVDPFAALMAFAEWEASWRRSESRNQESAKALVVEELRRLKRLRSTTDEEKRTIEEALSKRWSLTLAEMREVAGPITDAVRHRKEARRRAAKEDS